MQNAECRTVGAISDRPNAECRTVGAIIDRPNAKCRVQSETEMQNYNVEYCSTDTDGEYTEDLTCDYASEDEDAEEISKNTEPDKAPTHTADTKSHLSSSVPRAARIPSGALTKGEMAEIRQIFGNMDDAEIQRLYKRVTK